ncbi:hypothetical protein ACHAW6_007890 [Cyclotella cf. meneghiniana]
MNYAEDRLDRRARASSACSIAVDKSSSVEVGGDEATSTKSTTSQELEHDLNQAHSVIRRCSAHASLYIQFLNDQTDQFNLSDDHASVQRAALKEVLQAHQLAGRTLRDRGSNRQAVFHFGVAWKICHCLNSRLISSIDDNESDHERSVILSEQPSDNAANSGQASLSCPEWKAVGDYAQMAEFAGFPEVGVIALMYYRAGGSLKCSAEIFEIFPQRIREHEKSNDHADCNDSGCGCGLEGCGSSPCYVAFSPSSALINNILQALDELSLTFKRHSGSNVACCSKEPNKTLPSALDILNQLSLISGKTSVRTSKDRLFTMHQYMKKRMNCLEVPTILQFWNTCDKNLHLVNTSDATTFRTMHSVLLLLLLKLLYSSPIAGPFLRLACQAVPYLSAFMPTSSIEGRLLAQHYKSHWAYYIFIRALVLGERIKKKQSTDSVYHTPVWDICFGSDVYTQSADKHLNSTEKCKEHSFSVYMRDILDQLTNTTIPFESPNEAAYIDGTAPNPAFSFPSVHSLDLPHPPIYVLGDSHVLSLAWQYICISHSSSYKVYRTFVPFPATGIKAWHFKKSTQFFTNCNLQAILERLLRGKSYNQLQQRQQLTHTKQTIIISAGEIDCREGIGGSLLQGYYENCNDAVEHTVLQYLNSVSFIAKEYDLQVLLMPVAPHAYRSEKNGKALGRAKRRETMCLWNNILRDELRRPISGKYADLFLLDFEERLRLHDPQSPVGYVLHPSYNADYTHVNSAVVRLLQESLHECGCDFNLF